MVNALSGTSDAKVSAAIWRIALEAARRHGVDVMQSSGGIISARVAAASPCERFSPVQREASSARGKLRNGRGWTRSSESTWAARRPTYFWRTRPAEACSRHAKPSWQVCPIGVPMLDIHTAGAGGGSIARFDVGGMLRVGPKSAGADPGPICFGRGTQPTVTDANFLLGRLDEATFLGGGVQLDRRRTEAILHDQKGPLENGTQFAAGILRVIDSEMERAIRVISVERGHDPREFTLVAFGEAGRCMPVPLPAPCASHVCWYRQCLERFRRSAFCSPIRCAISPER